MNKIKLVFVFFLAAFSSQAQVKGFLDQPYLEVNGEADTLVTPNQIFIKIILAEKDTKDKTSVEDLEKKMVNVFKNLSINVDKDLITSDMESEFKTYVFKRTDILKSKEYILKVKDALTTSKVFIELEKIGVSNTSIHHVEHSGLESIGNMMRSKAVEVARAKAIALTRPLKQSIGPAVHLMDVQPTIVKGYATRGVYVNGVKRLNSSVEELPAIEFEKIRVSANISVKFILK